ncbi:MAG: DUF4148 domain-containing protein [Rhizobiales bacterium]|nr:DUF4148 domain-containing protein [Rhizobacter sp.]
MNSKFLYAATVAVSLIGSTVAMAQEAPLSRAQVSAELQQAIANGTLQRTDYEAGSYRPEAITSGVTRAQVVAELAQDKIARKALVGPQANVLYNPEGTQIFWRSTLARSDVRNEVLAAAANGTLQRTDYDDAESLARKAKQHAASARFAQRVKAKLGRDAS